MSGSTKLPFRLLTVVDRSVSAISGTDHEKFEIEVATDVPRHVRGDLRQLKDRLFTILKNAVQEYPDNCLKLIVANYQGCQQFVSFEAKTTRYMLSHKNNNQTIKDRIMEESEFETGGSEASHGRKKLLALDNRRAMSFVIALEAVYIPRGIICSNAIDDGQVSRL